MKNTTIQITTGTIIKTVIVLALAALLWTLRDLVLIIITAIVIAASIEPATRLLTKRKIPRTLAVLGVYATFFAVFFGTIFFLVPPVLSETTHLLSSAPTYLPDLSTVDTGGFLSGFGWQDTAQQVSAIASGESKNFFALMSLIFGGVLGFVLIIVFSFYFALSERGIEEFLRVITPIEHERYILDLWHRSQRKIGLWLQGQFLLAVIVGVLAYLGLTIIGVPYALVLAVVAAVFELIPVFGPILSSVPAIAIALSTGGLTTAIIVAAFYLIIHQFENHLIYPLVVTKVVGVPPILVILALLVGAELAGFLGVLLAVPLAAVLQELFADLDKKRGVRHNAVT